VLLDLNLPGLDGREVLRRMRADPVFAEIPVVILTSSLADADVHSSYDMGANCYIAKTVRLDQFRKTVAAIEEFWLTVVTLPEA